MISANSPATSARSSGGGERAARRIAAAVLALALAGGAAARDPRREAVAPGARYVALGSSFAAGPMLGPAKPGTPARCMRTAANYPTLLADRLRLALTDVTCSGATTANMLEPWGELPAQIDAVTHDTRLVTITIGGNDLGYIAGLMGSSCRASARAAAAACPPARAPGAADYARVTAKLREIARQIAARAPDARLVFVQYVTLVPHAPCDAARLAARDAAISRAIGRRLAAITAKVAADSGATALPTDMLSRDHTACSPEPWSNGMTSGHDGSGGAPWHPNAAGMRAIADALAARLQRVER